MFRGAAAVNLDAKGRVAIPTRYRAEIMEKNQGQMVCTVDIRQPCFCLLYTSLQKNFNQWWITKTCAY